MAVDTPEVTSTVIPGEGYGGEVARTGDRLVVIDGNSGAIVPASPEIQKAVADYYNASATLEQIRADVGGAQNLFPGGDTTAFQARYAQYDLSAALAPYDSYENTRNAVVQDMAFRTQDLQPGIRAMADAAISGKNTNVTVGEGEGHGVGGGRPGGSLEIV